MNTVKVIPFNYIDKNFYRNEYDNLTKELYNDPDIVLLNAYYMHGELEDDFGYDKCEIMNLGDLNINFHNIPNSDLRLITIPNGIYDVKIVGFDRECIGYFWAEHRDTQYFQRGLICYKTDYEACNYAAEKFNKKSELI